MKSLTPAQKSALIAACVAFAIALANVFGVNIPVVPAV